MSHVRAMSLLLCLCLVAFAYPGLAGGPRPVGDVEWFADVPAPGFPEGIVVSDGLAWVGTPASLQLGFGLGPSTLYGYALATGHLARTYTFTGEDMDAPRGTSGLAVDAEGRIYALNVQAGLGVLRINMATNIQEHYAVIPDLPTCHVAPAPCSPTLLDRPAFPNDLAFDAAGNLYVSDSMQATIWKIPPGPGEARIWFQDARLDQSLGPNGLLVTPDGTGLMLAVTFRDLSPLTPTGIYHLPLTDAPGPDDFTLFYESNDGVDNLAYGASGTLYAVLAGANQVAFIAPDGTETARHPDAATNLLSEHPLVTPAAIGFRDATRSILITNHALFTGLALPEQFEVLDMYVDDVEEPEFMPLVP